MRKAFTIIKYIFFEFFLNFLGALQSPYLEREMRPRHCVVPYQTAQNPKFSSVPNPIFSIFSQKTSTGIIRGPGNLPTLQLTELVALTELMDGIRMTNTRSDIIGSKSGLMGGLPGKIARFSSFGRGSAGMNE
jgi:hypothetical protein